MIAIAEDRPIEHMSDDLFGRKPIVDMISRAIINKAAKEHSCYVIGVYGKWGEGKSSVFKLVKEQLLANKEDQILISEFNPWLFKDQESLLMEFFNVLADERIDKVFAAQIKKYAPIVALGVQGLLYGAQFATGVPMPWIPWLGKRIRKVGDSMPDSKTTVSERKKEISKTLKASGKHLVIFIDDIDRLDKEETHAVFKLIKQNADFDNVIYLLAMDVEMVAKSISGRFGKGEVSDGYNFIDKIVQVPITLPQIQASHLKSLFHKQLNEILSGLPSAHSSVTDHITGNIDKIVGILGGLFETRRDMLRYTNQIQFIFPLLYEEVNIFDLCMLEAIKLFHPIGYRTIHRKRNVILRKEDDSTMQYFLYRDKPDELKRIKEEGKSRLLDSIMEGCSEKYVVPIQRIITDHLLHSFFHDNSRPADKSLSNASYFDKYFISCPPDDVISDLQLYALAEQLNDTTPLKKANDLDLILDKYGWEELKRAVLFVINLGKDVSDKNVATRQMAVAVSLMRFVGNGASTWSVETFLSNIINQMYLPPTNSRERAKQDEDAISETCEIIIANAALDFILFFAAILYEDLSIATNKKAALAKQAIDRIISERNADELLKVGKYTKVRLFAAWAITAQTELDLFIEQKLSEAEFDVVEFLEGFIEDGKDTYIDTIFPHNQPLYDAIHARVPEEKINSNAAIQSFLKSYKTIRIPISKLLARNPK